MKHLINLLLLAGVTFTVPAQTDCGLPHDINNNGSVDIEDFLSILGLFGDQDSDGDGIYDSQDNCFDLEACNFMEVDAEFCSYPDAIGDCNGNCPLDVDGDGVCDEYSCGNPVSYQGYDYATVFIGQQCWFAENLRSTDYSNGDDIAQYLWTEEWSSTSHGAVAIYGEGGETCFNPFAPLACDQNWALSEFGRLYNLYAVQDPRGICPTGWHVSTRIDWEELIEEIGVNDISEGALNTSSGWDYGPFNGTNTYGFNAVAAGFRAGDNGSTYFINAGVDAWWWTSNADNYVGLGDQFGGIQIGGGYPPTYGFSVRCIQD